MYLEAADSLKRDTLFELVYHTYVTHAPSDRFLLLFRKEALEFMRQMLSSFEPSSYKFVTRKLEELYSKLEQSPLELKCLL